jgi:hypothetical protein
MKSSAREGARKKKKEGCFTIVMMKNVFILFLAIDMLVLGAWISLEGYVLNHFWSDSCFQDNDKSNFLIIFHFTLCASIADIVSDISKEEARAEIRDGTIKKLPYEFYKPVLWAVTGLISLAGDAILLSAGTLVYQLSISNGDSCSNTRLSHIAVDVLALSVTILAIIWFIIFSFYYIKHKKNINKKLDMVERERAKLDQ